MRGVSCASGVVGAADFEVLWVSPAMASPTSRFKKLSVKLISMETLPFMLKFWFWISDVSESCMFALASGSGTASVGALLPCEVDRTLSSPVSYTRMPNRTLLPVPGVLGERKMPLCPLGRGVCSARSSRGLAMTACCFPSGRVVSRALPKKIFAVLPRSAMSRLIVKGLPPYLTDVRLREHFAQKGSVTDAKLMKRPDGTSRRFGFVGYRSEEEAQAAQAYFDRTYIDTARISVTFAKQVDDEELEKRRSVGRAPRAASEKEKASKKRKSESSGVSGASFEEFLSVMAPKLKRKSWQNNEDLEHVDHAAADAPQPTMPKNKKKPEPPAAPAPAPPKPSDTAATDEQLSDLEYMRRRMRHKVAGGEEEKVFEQSDSEASSASESESESEDEAEENAQRRARLEAEQRKEEENVDTIMQSGRLFVRNLPFSATEDELDTFFSTYGPVAQVRMSTQWVGVQG